MMDSGMRPEEAMRMRKEHIFWDRSVVLVPNGKSFKSKRYVPLSDRLRNLLRLRKSGDTPWVFPSKRASSEVKELMGHEDVKTTMQYLHPNTSGSAAVVNQRNYSQSLRLLKAAG
jgi:integrase